MKQTISGLCPKIIQVKTKILCLCQFFNANSSPIPCFKKKNHKSQFLIKYIFLYLIVFVQNLNNFSIKAQKNNKNKYTLPKSFFFMLSRQFVFYIFFCCCGFSFCFLLPIYLIKIICSEQNNIWTLSHNASRDDSPIKASVGIFSSKFPSKRRFFKFCKLFKLNSSICVIALPSSCLRQLILLKPF